MTANLLRAFGWIRRPLSWFLFFGGIAGFVATWPLGLLPKENPTIMTLIGWILITFEGFNGVQVAEDSGPSDEAIPR